MDVEEWRRAALDGLRGDAAGRRLARMLARRWSMGTGFTEVTDLQRDAYYERQIEAAADARDLGLHLHAEQLGAPAERVRVGRAATPPRAPKAPMVPSPPRVPAERVPGEEVRAIQERLGLSAAQVAAAAGVTRSRVSEWRAVTRPAGWRDDRHMTREYLDALLPRLEAAAADFGGLPSDLKADTPAVERVEAD